MRSSLLTIEEPGPAQSGFGGRFLPANLRSTEFWRFVLEARPAASTVHAVLRVAAALLTERRARFRVFGIVLHQDADLNPPRLISFSS